MCITLQKIYISNKCCSFELSIHQRILGGNCITVSTKYFSRTIVFNIDICILASKINTSA